MTTNERFVAGCILAATISIAWGGPAEDLQRFAAGYESGDVVQLGMPMAADIEHDGTRGLHAVLTEYQWVFERSTNRQMEFYSIAYRHPDLVARFHVVGIQECWGRIWISYDGPLWDRFEYRCYPSGRPPADQPIPLDGAVLAQAADVGTTAAGIGLGLAEANPVLAAGGLPVAALAKLGGSLAAESLPPTECADWKSALASTGAAASAWNLAMLGLGATGIGAPLAIIGFAVGTEFLAPAAMDRCADIGAPQWSRITATSIDKRRPGTR